MFCKLDLLPVICSLSLSSADIHTRDISLHGTSSFVVVPPIHKNSIALDFLVITFILKWRRLQD